MDFPLDACVTPKFTSLFVMRMQAYEIRPGPHSVLQHSKGKDTVSTAAAGQGNALYLYATYRVRTYVCFTALCPLMCRYYSVFCLYKRRKGRIFKIGHVAALQFPFYVIHNRFPFTRQCIKYM